VRAAQEAARSADIQRVASAPLILVADDDDDLRLLVSLRLERVGYRVVSARNGKEALDLAAEHQPDLLLLDVSMPIMGGHDLCRAIAASQASPPPVIFLSAHGSPEDKVKGFDAGAVDYIAKPFNATELMARVAAALRTSSRMATLERDATIDHLTGVPNRAQLDHRLIEAVSRTTRNGGELGCVLIDLDGFKSINDRFGHQTGDVVLRVVATRLSGTLRGGDVLFRYGGEEFFLLLEGTDAAGTLTVAARSIAAIGSEPIMNVEVTASAGTANWSPRFTEPAELLNAADLAMYDAKRNGGAQVQAWRGPDRTVDVAG
jgi:two-component system cell cycle response regulator